jgi:hypothetical protein
MLEEKIKLNVFVLKIYNSYSWLNNEHVNLNLGMRRIFLDSH